MLGTVLNTVEEVSCMLSWSLHSNGEIDNQMMETEVEEDTMLDVYGEKGRQNKVEALVLTFGNLYLQGETTHTQ